MKKARSIYFPALIAEARAIEARRNAGEKLREIAESLFLTVNRTRYLAWLSWWYRQGEEMLAENPTSFEGFDRIGFKSLSHSGIYTLKSSYGVEGFADLVEGRWSAAELRRLPGIGPKGVERVRAIMKMLGLALRPDDEPGPERHVRQSISTVARLELNPRRDPRGDNVIPFPTGRIVRQLDDDQPPAA